MSLTDAQLLDLDVGQRQSSWRFEVRNLAGSPIGTVKPIAGRASIENNVNRSIKRSLTGLQLAPSDVAAIDPLTDRLAVKMVLENGSEYGCGVFLFADASSPRASWGSTMEATLVDELFAIDQPLAASLSLPAGTSVATALAARFGAHGVLRYLIDGSAAVLRTPMVWPIGTSGLAVFNDLAALGGYFSPYFDNEGLGRMRLAGDVDLEDPDHAYEGGPSSRIVAGSIVESDDALDAANLYVVVDNSVSEAGFVGRYEVPSTAPHSRARRGFYVVKVSNAQGLTSASQADAAAFAAAQQDAAGYAWVSFDSAPDPRHDTFDVVDFLGLPYREHSWTMTLVDGRPMRHSLRRVWS